MHRLIEGISDGTESGIQGPMVCCKGYNMVTVYKQTNTHLSNVL